MNIYRHNAIIKVFRQDGNPTEQQITHLSNKTSTSKRFYYEFISRKTF